MSGKGQHVVPRDGRWGVRRTGSDRATRLYDTQQEAIDEGRRLARDQRTVLYIHGRDGLIRDRISFGAEAQSSKG